MSDIPTITREAELANAKRQLAESEDRLALVARATNAAVWDCDLVNGTVWWNDEYDLQYGPRPQESQLSWQWWVDRIHEQDRDRILQSIQSSIEGDDDRWQDEYRFLTRSGDHATVMDCAHISRNGSGKATRILGTMLDLSEFKRVERLLQASESRFHTLAENASSAVFIWSATRFRSVNPAMEDITGYSGEELLTMDFWEVVHPDYRELVKQRGLSRLKGESIPIRYETKILKKGGQVRWVDLTAGRTEFDGEPAVLGVVNDITMLKVAEETVRRLEEGYQDLYDQAADMHLSIDTSTGRIVRCNETTCRRLGFSKEQLTSKSVFEIYHPDCLDDAKTCLSELKETGEVGGIELQVIDRDGKTIDVSLKATAQRDNQGNIVFSRSTWRDITARKCAEREVAQRRSEVAHLSRLNTMGALVSGLAHELNQPLNAIVAYATGIARRATAGTVISNELLDAINQIVGEAERAANVIRGMRRLAYRRDFEQDLVDSALLVSNALELCAAEAHNSNIDIRLRLTKSLPRVLVDCVQIEQVILGLLVNAMDSTKLVADRWIEITTSSGPTGHITISVSDSGSGIADDAVEQVFNPFYSTKAEGLGMGLSICQSIVEYHGGRIWWQPHEMGGAQFLFTIPTCPDKQLEK